MFHLVKDNKIILSDKKRILSYLRDEENVQYPMNIFDVWSEDELQSKGIYEEKQETIGSCIEFRERKTTLEYDDKIKKPVRKTQFVNISVTDARKLRKSEIARMRYNEEVGGYSYEEGYTIDTTRQSIATMNAFSLMKVSDTVNWKTKEGNFITLQYEDFVKLTETIKKQVQDLFNKEKDICDKIDKMTLASLRKNTAEKLWNANL